MSAERYLPIIVCAHDYTPPHGQDTAVRPTWSALKALAHREGVHHKAMEWAWQKYRDDGNIVTDDPDRCQKFIESVADWLFSCFQDGAFEERHLPEYEPGNYFEEPFEPPRNDEVCASEWEEVNELEPMPAELIRVHSRKDPYAELAIERLEDAQNWYWAETGNGRKGDCKIYHDEENWLRYNPTRVNFECGE